MGINNIDSARERKNEAKKAILEAEKMREDALLVKKEKEKETRYKRVMMAILFIFAIGIIIYIFPSIRRFKYTYEIGKPWIYESLTAPFNFPIHKTSKEINDEFNKIKSDKFTPYYIADADLADNVRHSIMKEAIDKNTNSDAETDSLKRNLRTKLKEIYKIGIIPAEQLIEYQKDKISRIKIKSKAGQDSSAYEEYDMAEIYTKKRAYEAIINSATSKYGQEFYNSLDLEKKLEENLTYESSVSNQDLTEIYKNISEYKDQVQKGEKIVQHGEKIDEATYRKLNSLKEEIEGNTQETKDNTTFIGQCICVLCILTAFYLYLMLFREKFISFKNVVFMLAMIIGLCALTAFVVRINRRFEPVTIWLIPYALVPIVISTFFDTRTALFTHLTTVLLCSLISMQGFEFLLMQTIIGMICISTLKHLYQRSQLVKSAIIMILIYIASYCGTVLIHNSGWSTEDTTAIYSFIINGALLMLAYPLIFIMEKMFSFVSDVTLVELANTNNPLLRTMSEVAPGTFQHSLQVSNLAGSVAQTIKANPMLARAGALYHDIGKMTNPIFFTENQNGYSPHKFLDEKESVQYIIQHVSDGLTIARKNGIPRQIQEFIETHHGRGIVKSFYNAYCNKHPNENVDSADFMYPGKWPESKEQVIVMMCDQIEAASRAQKQHTMEDISALVDNIVKSQLDAGAYDNAPITLKEVSIIKAALKEKLHNMYHTRIRYPELRTKLKR